jgi:hypothetical protein
MAGSNRISDLGELDRLADGDIRQPLDINLQGNPVCRKPRYRAALIHAFPSLQVIDNRSVTEEERDRALSLVSPDV